MSTRPRKQLLIVGVFFFSGLLLGLSAALLITEYKLQKLLNRANLGSEEWLIQTFNDRLELSDEQLQAARGLYGRTDVERQLARIRTRPDLNAPAYKFMDQFELILDPVQREKLEALTNESITANRAPCFRKLLDSLKMNMREREGLDKVLAEHAADPAVVRPTLNETCIALLQKSAKDVPTVLNTERVRLYTDYIEELKNKSR